jgi:flagellar hook-length control protein FliK
MMNSSVSISDLSPKPAEIPDKSSLGLKKSGDEGAPISPFHELMRELAAQQVGGPAQPQIGKMAGSAIGLTATEGERQETAVSGEGIAQDAMPGLGPEGWGVAEASQLSNSAMQVIQPGTPDTSPSPGQGTSVLVSPTLAGLPWIQGGAPAIPGAMAPPQTMPPAAVNVPDLNSSHWGEWKETRLSQSLTLITQPLTGLNETNLNDFAMQQGLDANTVKWLLGESNSGAQGSPTAGLPHPLSLHQGAASDAWLDLTPIAAQSFVGLFKDSFRDHPDGKTGIGVAVESLLGASAEASDAGQSDSTQAGIQSQNMAPAMRQAGETQGAKQQSAWPLNTTLLGQDLADKMSTAIGKRLLESIEKGEWQLKLQLKPVELGHIEVDLQMKENGLEAKFTASQSMARELLESGLSRLKETLQQSGMDVASVRVNDGLSSRNGGDPTPRHPQQGHHGSTPQENVPNESEAPVAPGNSTISDGRLDLMV